MAADVDKRKPEDESRIPPQNGHRSPGSGSWVYRGMWTLLLVAAVPLLAFGIKNYQDAQLVKRHVRSTSGMTLHMFHHLSPVSIQMYFYVKKKTQKIIIEK